MMTNGKYSLFFKFIKPYRKKMIYISFLQILIILSTIAVPYLLAEIIHQLEIKQIDMKYLMGKFLLIIGVYLVWNLSAVFVDILFEYINKSIQNDIRIHCYKKILNTPMSKLQDKSEGEIISKVIRDTERIETTFSKIFRLLSAIVHSIFLVAIMMKVSVILASAVLTMYILVVVIQRKMSNPLKNLYKNYKHSEEMLLRELKNQLTGFFTLKIFSLEEKVIKTLNKRNDTNLKNHLLINKRVSIIKNINFMFSSMFRIATIIIGSGLYLINMVNIGQIFAIYTYSIHLSNLLRIIIEIDIVMRDISSSFNRITEFLEEFESEDHEKVGKIKKIKRIDFKNVDFKYDDKYVISNLSFSANKNDVIGIKGPNGSGKTTLTYLICGFYRTNGIHINGKDSNIYSEKTIMKRVSYVVQNVHLYPTSIMENLKLFHNVPDEKVIEVSKKIGLHEKILGFTDGYDTVVNEKNLNLSGGEKQLISLARALIKESDVLILDEMNSALDVDTEQNLVLKIKEFFDDKIIFIISHRENIFELCDNLIEL